VAAIRLIAGLGNPGPRYAGTPHNVGADFVHALAVRFDIALTDEPRFKGRIGRGSILDRDVRLLIPTTFMNLSGECVGAVATFYKYSAAEILVAHDERLKVGGGHNGHNGLRDIIASLGNCADFVRLRIGVGHPGARERVSGYLTGAKMRAEDRERVAQACRLSDELLALILAGETGKAMNRLHAAEKD